ncbi:uncharacterized protein LOC143043053 [Mytilus galloprovincialis]|uniref:uncharacterized protein LOC143043053 n=1 Tax=Mytilus galloprovincialis TaxID=29158 RepID=UPI003F7C4446
MEKTTLTASRNRKLAVSTLRESGGTREEAIELAKHMAHNVATADRYYDKSRRVESRHAVLDKLGKAYKDAAAEGQQQATGGSGVVPSRAEREQNLEELVVERSKVETGRPAEDTRQKKLKKKAPKERISKWNKGLTD